MNRRLRAGMQVGAMILIAGLIGCKGDEGPAGPAGTATCLEQCHSDSYDVSEYLRPYSTQYTVSRHATTETFQRMTSPCAGCHTTTNWFATYTGPHPGIADEGGSGVNHGGGTCRDCHTQTLKTATCTKCHEGNPEGGGEGHE